MAVDKHILLYQTADGETRLEVLYQDESLWLSQRDMAALFQKDVSSINRHIKNVYEERELKPDSTIAVFAIVQSEGVRSVSREISHYNLDMIISVGYRVNSYRGTHFRIWATRHLRELIIKGFVMDDDRLAHGGSNTSKSWNSGYAISALQNTTSIAKCAMFSPPGSIINRATLWRSNSLQLCKTNSTTRFMVTAPLNSFWSASAARS